MDVEFTGARDHLSLSFHGPSRALQRHSKISGRSTCHAGEPDCEGRPEIKGHSHHSEHRSPPPSPQHASVYRNGSWRFAGNGRPNAFNGAPDRPALAITAKALRKMAANTFAMEAITFLTSALVDRKAGDLRIGGHVQDVVHGNDLENSG